MIDPRFLGRPVSDIPRDAFWASFDDPSLPDDRFPGLVIASVNKVPSFPTDMFLAVADCGG